MCGIAGLFDRSRRATRAELTDLCEVMTARIAHRGPDSAGTWIDETAGVALGHRRLAILDLSPLGHQPMVSRSGRYRIAYNGELYNCLALRDELVNAGHTFRGTSDTEILLAALDQHGLDAALRRFEGMFAFALWDEEERRLVLVRDRFGEKPLYYAELGERIVFGSELVALERCPWNDWSVDRTSLALMLRDLYVPEPFAIYERTRKVPSGSYVEIRSSGSRPSTTHVYWSAIDVARRASERRFGGSFADAVAATEAALAASVRARCRSDVPLGAFLSGGIDSSTVVALMCANGGERVRTFSIGVADSELDEAPHARRIAELLGTDHTELYTSEREILEQVSSISGVYDEPFADSSQIPTFVVAKLARQHVTVALTGDGGDELFGGYSRYDGIPSMWQKLQRVPRLVRSSLTRTIPHVPAPAWRALAHSSDRFRSYATRFEGRDQAAARIRAIARCSSMPELYGLMMMQWKAPEDVVIGADPMPPLAQALLSPRAAPAEELMIRDTVDYLPNDLLVKVDRATMAVSLESRLPFLDTALFDLAWSFPLEFRRSGADGKRVLKAVLARHVPEHLFGRPKMGFSIPIGRWLKGPLRGWAESLLDERRLREEGYFDVAAVRSAWRRHLERDAAFSHEIWIVLQFQSWLEHRRARRAPDGGR